ncbi:hypothetical protein [Henriciella sp.]|uniref:hypothetical protein n=1 Tax=Henriciella sp. TaxID=1968823 RepID=UPI002602A553|nr:hypothetical protein [Henriciella sp.]
MTAIRQIVPEDIPAIARLVEDAGFPVRSEAGWRWVLFGNPQQNDVPPGLVAERGGRLVAMIGLQARDFVADGTPIQAVCGHTFISGKEGRGAGFALARRALKLHGSTAIYSLNNNAIAGTFHKKIGLEAWLGAPGRVRMEWPVQPLSMVTGQILTCLARRESIYDWLSERELFASVSVLPNDIPGAADGIIRLHPEQDAHARLIDEFGKAVSTASMAAPARTAAVYDWQMSDPDAPGRSILLGLIDNSMIDGLIQLVVTKPNSFEPPELEISDMVVRPGLDPVAIVPRLVRTARKLAHRARLARVRLPFSARFEDICFRQTGVRVKRRYAYDPSHASFSDKSDPLATSWVPTGMEGDMFFALRIAPEQPARFTGRRQKYLKNAKT